MLYQHEDYRDILQTCFDERHGRNPSYSLRAFARDLKLSPSRLSEVLSRRHHLSASKAEGIGRQLSFADGERTYFKDLVESQTGRTEAMRQKARARMHKYRFDDAATALRIDEFKAISDWHHFAILELFKTRNFKSDPKWVAKSLGIGVKMARDGLARLARLGFIETSGKGSVLKRGRSFTDSDTSQAALRDFHKQILERAALALHTQTKTERVTLAAVAAIDRKSLASLRAEVKALVGKFVTENAVQHGADHVYCLTVQLFKMDEGNDDAELS